MARSFSSASSQYLSYGLAWIASEPLTMACWFKPTSDTVSQTLMSICDTNAANSFVLGIGAGGADAAIAQTTASGSGAAAATTNRITPNAWNHAAAVFTSSSSRSIVVNNNTSTNALSRVVSGLDTSYIAAQHNGTSLGSYFNGSIAECAIWSAALTVNEIKALWQGRSPLTIRRESLIAYYPLGGFQGQFDSDFWRSGLTLSPINSPTWSDHPKIVHVPTYGGIKVTYAPLVPITLTPDVITATSSSIAPSLTFGSLSLDSPTIAGTASVVSPSYSIGALTLETPTTTATSESLVPSFVLGALSLSTPTVAASSSVYQTSITLGALLLVTSVVQNQASVVDCSLTISEVSLAVPTVENLSSVVSCSLLLSAVSLSVSTVENSSLVVDCSLAVSAVTLQVPTATSVCSAESPRIFIITPVQWADGGLSLVTTSLASDCDIVVAWSDACSLILVSEKACNLVQSSSSVSILIDINSGEVRSQR